MFVEYGYSKTSPKMIAKELDISLGNITYYFPTKEHLLAILIEMLAKYQWRAAKDAVDDGESDITALCFELTAMAVMCEESEVARDLYIAAYTKQMALDMVRTNDVKRAKEVFAGVCPDWTDEQFRQAELLVSGIEYATLRTTSDSPPLETRIAGAMNSILAIYNVPEERRRMKVERALSLDYRKFGREVLQGFVKYVADTTESYFDRFEQVGRHYVLKKETE